MPVGASGVAFMRNLPEEGTYVVDQAGFNQLTERNDVPQQQVAYQGLGGGDLNIRIPNSGIFTKLRVLFKGSLVVAGGGTCTPTFQWPYNIAKKLTLNANGQTSIISCEGLDLRARRQRVYRTPREQINIAPSIDANGDPTQAVIANGTYPVTIAWDVPIVHDDFNLTGAIYAQSDQNYLSWIFKTAAAADLFTLAGGSTATLTGTISSTVTFYDIPLTGKGVVIPSLAWLHGYVSYDVPFANNGEVKSSLVRNTGQMLALGWYVDNGGANQIDPLALTEQRFEYGANRRPRTYNPPEVLVEKQIQDYGARIKPGYSILDFEVDNVARDVVYPKGVTELVVVNVIPTATSINANARVHIVDDILYAGS